MKMEINFDLEQMKEICSQAVLNLGGVGFAGCKHCPHRDEETGLCHKVLETFGSEIFTREDSPCIWFEPERWRSKDAAN